MITSDIETRGLVLLGCGKMGSAMLAGWLKGGLPASSVWVLDPNPSDWLQATGVHINVDLPAMPALVLVAVKPQMMGDALPKLQALGNGETLFVSVAAGTSITSFEETLGAQTPIVRAMPNTPALLQQGATGLYAADSVSPAQRQRAEQLFSAIGVAHWVGREELIDTVTALSGSGPAYFFLAMEALQKAGESVGLSAEVAEKLAIQTALGAARMASESEHDAAELRRRVTSPGGTTEQALNTFNEGGLTELYEKAVKAAANRGKELAEQLDN